MIVASRSFWNSFITSIVSAPTRRRNAAASKVREPVRTENFFVSSTMPASSACASIGRMSRWLDRVLQKLGHKLRRRGGKRLVQIQHDLLDIIRRAAVVVDDGNTGNGFQQRARLDLIGPVRVDDDEQTARVRLDKRVLPGEEDILIVARCLAARRSGSAGRLFLQVDHDVRGLPALAAQAPDADRRAERVQVCHPVPHDEDLCSTARSARTANLPRRGI